LWSFANRVIDIWNNLPTETVNVSNNDVFKKKLDQIHFTPYMLHKT